MNRQKLSGLGIVLSIFALLGMARAQETIERPQPRPAHGSAYTTPPPSAAMTPPEVAVSPAGAVGQSADSTNSPDQAAIPLGSYTAAVEKTTTINNAPYFSGEYQLTFLEGGKFRFGRNDFVLFNGTYVISGDRVEISATTGLGVCATAAVYQWQMQGNRLGFNAVAGQTDGCAIRSVGLTAGAFFKNDPAAAVWKPLGPEGGRVYAVLVNDGKVFAAGDGGGVFVSTDNGQNWRPTRGIRGHAVFALAAFNGRLFAGATGGRIFISNDGGQTWEYYAGGIASSVTIQDFVESNGRLYAATLGDGVWRMTDNPYVWQKAGGAGLTNQRIYTLAAVGGRLVAGTDGGGVFVSTDGGDNWASASAGLTLQRIRALAANGNTLYAGTIGGAPTTTPNEVFISEDFGQTWRRLGNGLAASFPANFTNVIYELAVSNGRLFAASTTGVIAYSASNWSAVHEGSPVVSFFSVAAGANQLFAGAWYDGVSRSPDGGATWSNVSGGFNGRYTWSVFKDKGVLYAGVSDGAFVSHDEGRTWTRSNPAVAVTYSFLAFDNKVYAGTGSGIFVTADQGRTWTRVSTGLGAGIVYRMVAVGNALYAAVYNNTTGGVFRSVDGGQNWAAVNTGLTSRLVNDLVAIGGNLFVCTDSQGVFRSSDEGQNWAAARMGLPAGAIYTMTATGNTLLAAVVGQAVYRSSDNGQTWTKSQEGVDIPAIYSLYASSGTVFAASDDGCGVLRSTDEGRTWRFASAGYDSRFGNGFFAGGATLYAATLNGVYVSTGLINQNTTVSAASFSAGAIADKAIVAAFGVAFASTTQVAASLPLPTTLAGTMVKVKDGNGVERNAPLYFVSGEQVNFQIPADTAVGAAAVTITSSDGVSATGAIDVKAAAPAIFTLNSAGTGAAAAVDALTGAAGPFNAAQANGQPNIIAVFGTALGGDATDADGNVNASVTARIDSVVTTLLYAGRAPGFAGLNQFNVVLPAGITSGAHTLTLARGGATSNSVTIAIR